MTSDWNPPDLHPALKQGTRALTRRDDVALRGIDLIDAVSPRILCFPEPQSVGMLYAKKRRDANASWIKYAEAKGTVMVPPGNEISLALWFEPTDLSFLDFFQPGSIDDLEISMNNWLTDDDLKHLRRLIDLAGLNISQTKITSAGLAHVRDLTKLRVLNVRYTNVHDDGLAHLESLKLLRELYLSTMVTPRGLSYLSTLPLLQTVYLENNPDLGDAAAAVLSSLQGLRHLVLDDVGITDVGLSHLERLTSLRSLDLSFSLITDRGLASLAYMPFLDELCLRSTAVTDTGLDLLRELRNLAKIDLSGCRGVTDRGLVRLASMDSLTEIDLWGCPAISDVGLVHLASMRRLRHVSLPRETVSEGAIARLRLALPDCKVSR